MNGNKLAAWSLRAGLAFVFAYASLEIFINPENFLKFTPTVIFDIIPVQTFLYSFSVLEVLLAVWLLTGWKPAYPGLASCLMMFGIIISNTEHFPCLFRNVAVGFGGLALFLLEASPFTSQSRLQQEPQV